MAKNAEHHQAPHKKTRIPNVVYGEIALSNKVVYVPKNINPPITKKYTFAKRRNCSRIAYVNNHTKTKNCNNRR